MLDEVTPSEIRSDLIRQIEEIATRHKRASNEHDLLLRDLVNIETVCGQLKSIEAKVYTRYEYEQMKLDWLSNAIFKS